MAYMILGLVGPSYRGWVNGWFTKIFLLPPSFSPRISLSPKVFKWQLRVMGT